MGRLVKQEKINEKLNISDLRSSVYYLRINETSKKINQGINIFNNVSVGLYNPRRFFYLYAVVLANHPFRPCETSQKVMTISNNASLRTQ